MVLYLHYDVITRIITCVVRALEFAQHSKYIDIAHIFLELHGAAEGRLMAPLRSPRKNRGQTYFYCTIPRIL